MRGVQLTSEHITYSLICMLPEWIPDLPDNDAVPKQMLSGGRVALEKQQESSVITHVLIQALFCRSNTGASSALPRQRSNAG